MINTYTAAELKSYTDKNIEKMNPIINDAVSRSLELIMKDCEKASQNGDYFMSKLNFDEAYIDNICPNLNSLFRVKPHFKQRVLKHLQENGFIINMSGPYFIISWGND